MTVPEFKPALEAAEWPDCPYRAVSLREPEAGVPADTLCLFRYGQSTAAADARVVAVPLALLPGSGHGELWSSRLPVRHGWDGDAGWSENGEVMVLHLRLEEHQLAPLADAVAGAYRGVAEVLARRGYPELLRVWHYLGDINQGEGDDERYRQFCIGRYRALADRPDFESRLPAASAIGSRCGGLTMIVLAGRQPGLQVENPRQVSAFRYPRAYGLRSPSFSRATLLPWADGVRLLVSGTSSIVGHATADAGDPLAQLRQTAVNLESLLAHAVRSRLPGRDPVEFTAESYTVYLRHPEHLPRVQSELRRLFGDTPLQVLAGDICRRELLVEVEGSYRMPAERA